MAALVFGLGAAPADAATVSVRPSLHEFNLYFGPEVAYIADAGERNRVVVHAAFIGSPWTVTDSSALLTAGPGCSAVDPHTVRCFAAPSPAGEGLMFADVQLGDLDDTATIVEPEPLGYAFALFAYGGTGNDVLAVPDPGGELYGGPGDDRLTSSGGTYSAALLDGGAGHDELNGGAGGDTLSDGDADGAGVPDVIEGGPGADTVSYKQRKTPVIVDLAARIGGAPGEGDSVEGVEAIIGGGADDTLAGDGGSNVIDGHGGHDSMIGRAGNDVFANGRGPTACGAGQDVVDFPRASDFLKRSCERIRIDFDQDTYPAYPTSLRSRSVRFTVHCLDNLYDDFDGVLPCSGRLTLRESDGQRRRLGRGAFPRGRWTDRRVSVVLTALGRRLAARHGGVRAAARLTIRHDSQMVIRWTIQLKTPRTGPSVAAG